ncbi:HPr family phosphocarrier protein [Paenibacillus validus]|uniref:HPr family phosphocarrier protein n=1 Tax=Paenibacillus validus TaxID=44253 RepID=A0A7X3CRY8_9BACL|nr:MULTISPECIES: HPr family phosphocarrier protein [Paenibacillus]MED4603729.1 HPr family phosphocarrier protein [Paenibacillus validus]MED4609197.1 HPr family phosphocarrier protein [Paenibacillus validus]MUG69462.1 HPr family phosphocarrier protein [Paenibacillus validus]
MQSRILTIINEEGMHLRPAQTLADAAIQFESDIFLETEGGMEANLKSVLGIIALGLEKGAEVKLSADGPDEEKAADEIARLFESGFGE